jgi:hypothetical protein
MTGVAFLAGQLGLHRPARKDAHTRCPGNQSSPGFSKLYRGQKRSNHGRQAAGARRTGVRQFRAQHFDLAAVGEPGGVDISNRHKTHRRSPCCNTTPGPTASAVKPTIRNPSLRRSSRDASKRPNRVGLSCCRACDSVSGGNVSSGYGVAETAVAAANVAAVIPAASDRIMLLLASSKCQQDTQQALCPQEFTSDVPYSCQACAP